MILHHVSVRTLVLRLFSLFPLLTLLTNCATPPRAPTHCDLWIRNGDVVDGTGAPRSRADVLVTGDTITWVGPVDAGAVTAARTLDATGCVVTPGFIDAHAHGSPLRSGKFENFRAMGVTTICLGMDGGSASSAPLPRFFEITADRGFGVNIAPFLGHGAARRAVGIGTATEVSDAQRAELRAYVADSLEHGAFGLTTGLEYEPGRFAQMPELTAAAQPLGRAGAVVMSHVRNEDDEALLASLDELFEQCRGAGCAAHISHLKVVYGKGRDRADAILAHIDAARRDGLTITADVYPYVASYTGIGIVFPSWARAPNDYEAVKATRRAELAAHLRRRVTLRNGPEATVFGSGPFAGQSLAAAATAAGKPFEDLLIDDVGPSGASAAYFVMSAEVMERFLLDPHVMVASDGSPTMRHPRGHGTFARVLREHVQERGLLTLEEAVRKMTSLPADTVGLPRRGRLQTGHIADLLVFDPTEVRDHATFADPYQKATGIRHIVVAGSEAPDAGRVLRRPRTR